MILKSIKTRQAVIIVFILLLVLIGALNFWFDFKLSSSKEKQTQIIDLERSFFDILLKEPPAMEDAVVYETLVNRYSQLRQHFSDVITDTEDELLIVRKDELEKKFFSIKEGDHLGRTVDRSFKELIKSVRYIHEHHIVYLKNAVSRKVTVSNNTLGDPAGSEFEQFESEIGILKAAAMIQTSLFDIFEIFNDVDRQPDFVQAKEEFTHRMNLLYRLINKFERYSFDAQDGIMAEELIQTFRQFEIVFSDLLTIEHKKKGLSVLLDQNKIEISRRFKEKKEQIEQSNSALNKFIDLLQFISIGCIVLLASFIIVVGKKTMDEAERTVKETNKIQGDIKYKIQIDETVSEEFNFIFTALNTMTYQINSYIQQIWASEKKYRLLIENQTDMIVTTDMDSRLMFVSPSCCKTFNKTQNELTGIAFAELFHESALKEISTALEKATKDPYNSYVEVQAWRGNQWRWQAWLNTAVLDKKGRVESVISVGRDIHDQKMAEEEKHKLYKAVETSPVSVVITDNKGSIEYVNPKFSEVTGYSSEEAMGKNPKILNSGLLPPELYKNLWKTIEAGNEWHGIFRNRRKNGDLYWESAAIAPVKNKNEVITHYLAVKEDITERRHNEKRLKEARKQAETADRAKSQFLANMSHEIRTPLNAVLGFLGLVLDETSPTRQQQEYLITAQESANNLLRIINDILDISKMESGHLTIEQRPFNLARLMNDLYKTMSVIAKEKQLAFNLDIHESVPEFVTGDSLRLRQVLINLVNNAIKFTQEGHVLIKVLSADHENQIQFMVEDTGIGIPAERIDQIFEPFNQADVSTTRRFGGTGLGVTIAGKMIELMGGNLLVESEEGKGSVFHFSAVLPAADPIEDKTEGVTVDKNTTTAPDHQLHIMLVEDLQANVDLAKTRLEKKGYQVTVAWNGREAVELYQKMTVDLILMDVQMPEMGGTEATRIIRSLEAETGDHIPILAMTASVMAEETKVYLQNGMDDVVAKPINFEVLFKKLDRILCWNTGTVEDGTQVDKDAAQASDFTSLTLNGIDIEKGMESWEDSEIYTEALQLFPPDFSDAADKLMHWIDNNDMEKAAFLGHSLKGVAGNLWMPDVAKTAAMIEAAIKDGQYKDARSHLPVLKDALDTVLGSIEQLDTRSDKQVPPQKELDLAAVKKLFLKLMPGFDEFNPYAIEPLLSELKVYIPHEQLHSIEKHVQQFDFETAKNEAKKLAGRMEISLSDSTDPGD